MEASPGRLASTARGIEVDAGSDQAERLAMVEAAGDGAAKRAEEREPRHVKPVGPVAPEGRLVDEGLPNVAPIPGTRSLPSWLVSPGAAACATIDG